MQDLVPGIKNHQNFPAENLFLYIDVKTGLGQVLAGTKEPQSKLLESIPVGWQHLLGQSKQRRGLLTFDNNSNDSDITPVMNYRMCYSAKCCCQQSHSKWPTPPRAQKIAIAGLAALVQLKTIKSNLGFTASPGEQLPIVHYAHAINQHQYLI